jgi:hypothetical protein
LPFGEFWYPTDDCDSFAAKAECVVPKMMGVAATAHVTPCQTERREMFVDHSFWLSAICVTPPVKDP